MERPGEFPRRFNVTPHCVGSGRGRYRLHLARDQPDLERRQSAILRHEGRHRDSANAVCRVLHLFAVQDCEGIDLVHDVAREHPGRRSTAILDLVAQGAQVISGDFVEFSILEERQNVPIDDVLAHSLEAVYHPGACYPLGGEVTKSLGSGQPELVALLL